MKVITHLALALALSALAGCRSWYDYHFVPAPQEAHIQVDAESGTQARALVSVVGIHRPDDGVPPRLWVRMRLENLSGQTMTLHEEGMEIVAADLVSFPLSELHSEEKHVLEPGTTSTFDAAFELHQKPNYFNFEGLAFKWEVDFGGPTIATSMNFQRVFDYRADPSFHFGVGYYH